MPRFAAIAIMALVLAAPAVAQTANGEPPRRFQPPPDHWMTIDSLSRLARTACALGPEYGISPASIS